MTYTAARGPLRCFQVFVTRGMSRMGAHKPPLKSDWSPQRPSCYLELSLAVSTLRGGKVDKYVLICVVVFSTFGFFDVLFLNLVLLLNTELYNF